MLMSLQSICNKCKVNCAYYLIAEMRAGSEVAATAVLFAVSICFGHSAVPKLPTLLINLLVWPDVMLLNVINTYIMHGIV